MLRPARLLFFVIHVGLILLYNVSSCWDSYHEVFQTIPKNGYADLAVSRINNLQKWPFVHFYASHSGMLCGYGFFGPQVGSSYELSIGLMDPASRKVLETDAIKPSRSEGRIRYRSFLTLYRSLLPNTGGSAADSLQRRIAKALACSVGQRLAARTGTKLAYCKVYVYQHPPLRTFTQNSQIRLVTLYERYFIPER